MKNKIKKVTLINPPQVVSGGGMRRIMPPLGLLYVASSLRQRGYGVDILDSPLEGYNQLKDLGRGQVSYGLDKSSLKQRLLQLNPDIVGVSSCFSSRHNEARLTAGIARETLGVPIIMGGLHSNIVADNLVISGEADYVVLGEGEISTPALLDRLNTGQGSLEGIVYLSPTGVVSSPPSKIKDLDALPFPARDLIDIERYFKIGLPFAPFSRSERAIQIFSSRGCPMNCNFCSTKNYWGNFRARSVENVLAEVKEAVEKYDAKELQFVDDNLTLNKKRSMALFKGLEGMDLNWCTPNGVMVSTIDEEVLSAMARSGAYQLSFAIESGSRRVREDIIGKRVPDKERVKHLIDVARENGIQTHGLFVLGFPGEKKEEIYESLQYPFDVGFNSVAFFILSPLPGSRLFEESLEKGYIDRDAARISNFRDPEIRIPKDSPDYYGMEPEELSVLIEEKTREFHSWSRDKFPEEWGIKFKNFLRLHPEYGNVFGRIH